MSEKPAILLVCLGNICRSPLAEAAFRRAFAEAGREAIIASAGTAGYHIGAPPDPRAIRAAAEQGIDISGYQANQVNVNDFNSFSHILALDSSNLADLKAAAPSSSTAKLALIMDAVPGQKGQSVADPYYGEYDDFIEVWNQIETAAAAWLTKI